ncbi:MAG TPA: hypothetical protein EYG89_04415 [Bacteroidia bacterium]|nr:hypothetical protein [Bacteroidia bacterium]
MLEPASILEPDIVLVNSNSGIQIFKLTFSISKFVIFQTESLKLANATFFNDDIQFVFEFGFISKILALNLIEKILFQLPLHKSNSILFAGISVIQPVDVKVKELNVLSKFQEVLSSVLYSTLLLLISFVFLGTKLYQVISVFGHIKRGKASIIFTLENSTLGKFKTKAYSTSLQTATQPEGIQVDES